MGIGAIWEWDGSCYPMDSRFERNAGEVKKNLSSFGIPVSRNRYGEYKYPSGANFIKDGRRYFIPKSKQREQARKAGIDYCIDLPQ